MASDKRLVWELGFVPDKNGLDQVKKMLTEITNAAKEPGAEMNKELQSAATAASQLKGILHKAWNSELGQLNLNKMKDAINSTYGSVGQLKTALTQCGDAGTRAFNGFASQVLNTNLHIKKSSKLLNDMATTFSNTVRYGISSSVFNRMANEISRAYDFSVQLDKSLNDIRIVTDKSANDMAKFAIQANRAAKAMGASTRDYTEASLIYFQQGLSDEEVKARTDVTIKAANVTAQATADVSEQLTAVWNGYKVSADEAELYIDKLAKVAAETAADLNELSVGMSKVASAANNAGVDIDQMNAMLATVVSVTREAPETIGTSFRTLFARMGDLKLGGLDEDGIGLGKVSSQLDAIGVKVLDQQGNMRNMGNIIEDLAAKWQTLTQAQQQAAAVAIGGKMQYSRLIALMDNWDMYTKTLETSRNAAGELQKEQDIYMQSTAAHLQKLKTEAERTYNTLFDMDVVNGFSDSLTGLLGVFNNFLEGLGGGTNAVLFFGSTLANVFSEQIGRGIETQIENIEAFKANLDAAKVKEELTSTILQDYAKQGVKLDSDSERVKTEADVAQRILNIKKALTDEEYAQLTTMQKQMGLDKERITQLENYKKNIKEIFNTENISLNTLQKKSVEYKAQIKQLQQQRTVGEELLSILYDDSGSSESRFDELTKILTPEAIQQLGLTKDQVDLIMNTVISGTKDVEGTANIVGNTIQRIDTELDHQVDTEQKINQAIEARQAEESGELQKIKERNAAQEEYLNQIEQQKTRQIAIQESVKLISSLVASITAISGIIKTINDDSLSLEDKISRIVPVAIGLLTTAIPMIISLPKTLGAISVGLGLVEKGTMANTLATGSWGAALWTALAPILPIILGVAAALALVTAAVYLGIKAWNADADAAKAAGENLKLVTESYNKAKEAADNLKQSISNYNDAIGALKDLRKGTEEYTKALEKANEEAKKLIETHNLYDNYTYEDGLIKIDEQALKDAQTRANAAASSFERQKYLAQEQYNQKRLTSNTTNTSRSVGLALDGQGMLRDVLTNILTYNPVTLGTSLSMAAAKNTKGLSNTDTEKIVAALQAVKQRNELDYSKITQSGDEFAKWIKEKFSDNNDFQILADSIGEQVSAFKSLVSETEEMVEAQKRYAKEINLIDLRNKYGEHFSESLSNQGEVDQVLNLLNNAKSEEQFIERKRADRDENNFLKWYQNWNGEGSKNLADNAELWSKEWGNNKNTLVTDILGDIGMSEKEIQERLGYSKLDSDQQLAEAWAKLNNIDLSQATFEKGKYVDTQGNVLVDVSSAEKRGTVRKNITETVGMEYRDARTDRIAESYREQNAQLLDNLIEQGKQGGEKFGADFSQSALNYLSDPNKEKLDLSSLVGKIDPNEVEQISQMAPEDVAKLFGLSDQALEEFGGESAEKVGLKIQESIRDLPWDIDAAIENEFANIQDTLPEGLSKKKLEEQSEEIKNYARHLMDIADGAEEAADGSNDLADSLKYDAKSAILVANSIIRMNSGIDKLAKNQENWIDILKKSNIESQEYFDALTDIRDAFGDLLDLSGDTEKYLDGDFFAKNADLIKQAAEGSEEAINNLRQAASEKVLLEIAIDNGLVGNEAEQFKDWLVNTYLKDLQADIPNFQVGMDFALNGLDESEQDFINRCQEIVNAANMTADQAKSFFETMGFETEFETEQKPVEKTGHGTRTVTELKPSMDVTMPDGSTMKVPSGWETKTYPGEPYKYVDYVDAIAMTTDGNHPKIKSFTKKATSVQNNYSSRNTGGGSPGGGSSKSSGGGGSSKKAKKSTPYEKEADRYHEIDSQIKLVTNDLQKLQKTQDKAFGTDLIENLNKQYALLAKQVENYNKKLEIAKKEYDELHESLSAAGVTFGEDGLINNYETIIAAKVAEYNALQEQYDKLSEVEKEKWDEDEVLSKAKTAMEKVFTDMDRSDTLKTDFINAIEENARDALKEQMAINIKKFNLEIQIRLDMQEAIKNWDKFKRDVIDDWNEIWKSNTFSKGFFDENGNWQTNLKRTAQEDLDLLNSYFYKNYESVANPGNMLQGSGVVGTQITKLAELQEEVKKAFNGQKGLFGENQYIETQTALDNLKEYKENAINTATEIKGLIDSIKGAYLGALQEATEEFSEQVDLLERAGKYIEHDMKLIKLIYGDNQYKSLSEYYEKQHENNLQQLDFQTKQRDFWKEQMDMAKENSDEWEYAKEQWLSAIDSANAALEQAVETAKEKWENAIDEVFERLDRKFTDGLGLDYIKEEWSLINKNSDEYLDAINSAYGIQKLQNKYLDAIDKSTDVNNQRRLNELMNSEVNYLQQIDRLTQTDLERAELKLQIALKQMELEDVQNNKTTMRLRRDSQGNYSYQFVANNDEIDKAKEELDELNNKLYNFDLKAYRQNLDKAASAYEEFMQKMAEAAKIVNEEDRIAKETLLKEQYYEYIGMLQDENERFSTNLIESATTEHGELYEQEALDFKNMTDQEIDAFMNDLVPQWKSGVQDMMDQWSGPDGFKESVEAAVDELMEKDQEYRDDLDKIQETAGVVFDDIKNFADDTRLNALEPFIQANDDIINRYEEQVNYIVSDLIPALQDLQSEYSALIAEINEANRLQGLESEQAANDASESSRPNSQSNDASLDRNPAPVWEDEDSGGGRGSAQSSGGNGQIDIGDSVTYTGGPYYETSYGEGKHGTRGPGKLVKVTGIASGRPYPIHVKSSDSAYGWLREDQLTGYDTGGYTGSWGDNGRLAVLHQKELVLNAQDTNNFLNALDIMRNIVNNIGSEAFSRLASLGGNRIGDPAFAGIEQNVVINADFPNATDHNEIQQAFDNLMNIASQRVNRNRI